jgi:hypothetical protein
MSHLIDDALDTVGRHAAQLADDAQRMQHFRYLVRECSLAGERSIGAALAELGLSRRTARAILVAVVAPECEPAKTPPFAKWFTCWIPAMWELIDYWPMLLAALACFRIDADTHRMLRKLADAKEIGDRAAAVDALFGPQGRLGKHRFVVKHPPPVFSPREESE